MGWPLTYSGAMYEGVPMIVPTRERCGASLAWLVTILAMPKSSTFR